MTISELTLKSNDDELVRRFEVFTGTGRRPDWSDDDKASIAAERYEPGATVSDIARRHVLSPQQLFGWRRLLRRAPERSSLQTFKPAAVDATRLKPETMRQPTTRHRRAVARSSGGIEIEIEIEIEIDGVVMRLGTGASPKTIGALKGGS